MLPASMKLMYLVYSLVSIWYIVSSMCVCSCPMCLALSLYIAVIPHIGRLVGRLVGGATAGEGVDRTPGPSAKDPRRWD